MGGIDGAIHSLIADEGGADANIVLESMHLQLGYGVLGRYTAALQMARRLRRAPIESDFLLQAMAATMVQGEELGLSGLPSERCCVF